MVKGYTMFLDDEDAKKLDILIKKLGMTQRQFFPLLIKKALEKNRELIESEEGIRT